MRHLIDIMELSVDELQDLIQTAEDIIARPEHYAEICKGKKLASCHCPR